jgi:hypothetical protein
MAVLDVEEAYPYTLLETLEAKSVKDEGVREQNVGLCSLPVLNEEEAQPTTRNPNPEIETRNSKRVFLRAFRPRY